MSVLVYTENWDGKFKKLTFELVSYATSLAAELGQDVICLSIGNVAEDELKKLGNYGASKVLTFNDSRLNHLVNQAYSSIIAQAAAKCQSNILVLANNLSGKAIAPSLSVKLKAGVVTGVMGLPVSLEPFVVRKKIYTGKAFTNITIKSPVRIVTLAQNSFEINEKPVNAVIEGFSAEIQDHYFKSTLKDVQKQSGKVLLTDAEIVVAGGRGMKGPEFWKPIEELAELLGAATACSRPVSDEGWRPHAEHVGQTGKIIAPNLYIACGISGAIQHLGGVSSSKYIVAINKDKDAPIFEAANYGIIGDVNKVLPEMISIIREYKAE